MDRASTERFVRQQISFARISLERLQSTEGLPRVMAHKQSVVMALQLGIERQSAALGAAQAQLDAGLSEWQNLTQDDTSWLNECISLANTLDQAIPVKSKPAADKAGLIASSTVDRSRHWSEAPTAELQTILDAFEGFVNRHSAASQEW